MSRLVMLPNARRVPEFPPVSPCGCAGLRRPVWASCHSGGSLQPKTPEADYLAAVRGIITGPWLVVANQHSGYVSGRPLGVAPSRQCAPQIFSGPLEGGNPRHCKSRSVQLERLTYIPDRADLEEIGQVDRGANGVAAIELSS
jgi:hypothetical protein